MLERLFRQEQRPQYGDKRIINYDGLEINVRNYVPLEELLRRLNGIGKIDIVAFTCLNDLSLILGSTILKPPHLVSDGNVTSHTGDYVGLDHLRVVRGRYIAWSGENASLEGLPEGTRRAYENLGGVERYSSEFYIETLYNSKELRKIIKSLRLGNINLSCESHSSKVGRPRKC